MRFARPWTWRDHYCGPMHPTGAERPEAAWDASATVEGLMAADAALGDLPGADLGDD